MDYVEAVLDLVALIPEGAVLAYGDVADLLGSGGARQVGSAMSRHGSAVPWWRVLKASGEAPPGHGREALALFLLEDTPLVGDYADYLRTGEGRWRVDMTAARWAPSAYEFDRIDAIAGGLDRSLPKLSAPDDEMTV
ncbi:DNA base-flipping protein [Arthrobacter sp. SO5]|nr:DNA base-flipping protein [Arthrobacter sp. SO5]